MTSRLAFSLALLAAWSCTPIPDDYPPLEDSASDVSDDADVESFDVRADVYDAALGEAFADAPDTHVPLDAPCEAGSLSCVGSERRGCGDAGGFVIETCATAKLCKASGCDAPTCATGAKRCAGTIVQACNADRTGYDDVKTCAAACIGSGNCLDVTNVAINEFGTFARMSDSTVYAWGRNTEGVYGDGSVGTGRTSPGLGPPDTFLNVASLSAGAAHVCALMVGGTVSCWGRNASGQLGDGTYADHFAPKTITGLAGVMEIGAGDLNTCARLSDGSVKCWGENAEGELGDTTKVKKNVPTPVAGIVGATSMSCGWSHCCAVVAGAVKCWGKGLNGQLGDGTSLDQTSPVSTVPALSGVAVVRANCANTCAVLADGTTRCWGYDAESALGDLGTSVITGPADTTGLTNVADIAVGEFWGCAVLKDGTAKCFGYLPTASVATRAATMTGVIGATRVYAADAVSCFTGGGALRCFGRNAEGQLGDGTVTQRTTPVSPKW